MDEQQIYEYEYKMKNRPHVVILGAGASVASVPNGDKNGRQISVMNGFLDNLQFREIIDGIDLITKSDNLEDIYSELYQKPEYNKILLLLEEKISKYFSKLELPSSPTIYDYILLSLRKKDFVATFNWDPFLLQAYQRVSCITEDLPDLAFLHGNVYYGICEEHKMGGLIFNNCLKCGKALKQVPLLYPIKNKNYNSSLAIRDSWNTLKHYMSKAYIVTIFGYSAPASDFEAIKILKDAWGNIDDRNLEEIEIIDIKGEDELVKTWKPFIHTHHYKISTSFFNSLLAKFPRRTCECLFDQLMLCKWLDGSKGITEGMEWEKIKVFFQMLLVDEINNHNKILNSFWSISTAR